MSFKDNMGIKPETYGVFNIKSYDENNNLIDDYTDNNLIVLGGREIMASSIGGVVSSEIGPINKFVMGTRGHLGNILIPVQVGETQPGLGVFDQSRTELFSEQALDDYFYTVEFNPVGPDTVKTESGLGGVLTKTNGTGTVTDTGNNIVKRTVSGNTTQYEITIHENSANISTGVVTFTEAALYSGDNLFAMKTFPARVKEGTVKFVITWSVIF